MNHDSASLQPASPRNQRERDPIVNELIRVRKERRISQQAVADMAGLSRRSLVAIESGGDFTLSTLRGLCAALDIELEARPPRLRPTLDDVTAQIDVSGSVAKPDESRRLRSHALNTGPNTTEFHVNRARS